MNLKSFKILAIIFIIGFSISSFAKPSSKRTKMEMLWPHTVEEMPEAQQKEYIDELRKAWLAFEKKHPQPKITSHFWQNLLLETAFAAEGNCMIGGAMIPSTGKGCSTTSRPCGPKNDGFTCGPIFNEECVDRTPVSGISDRCYSASLNAPLNKQAYEVILKQVNQNFTNVCLKPRSMSDGCKSLAKKFADITTKHKIKIEGLTEYNEIQTKFAEASKVSTPEAAAEESASVAETPAIPQSKLLAFGIGPGGKVLTREQVQEIMGNATANSATTAADTTTSASPSKPTAGLNIRACNPINRKNNKPILLPKFDLSLSCAFDNNQALLRSLDSKGCNKDRNMEYLFATRIQSKSKKFINNNASDIISGIIYSSEAAGTPPNATYTIKMLTHNVKRDDKSPPSPKDATYTIQQNGSRYYLTDHFGVKEEVDIQHVWRKTMIEVHINGASKEGAENTLNSITQLGSDCNLAANIQKLKTTSGLVFSPGSGSSPSSSAGTM